MKTESEGETGEHTTDYTDADMDEVAKNREKLRLRMSSSSIVGSGKKVKEVKEEKGEKRYS